MKKIGLGFVLFIVTFSTYANSDSDIVNVDSFVEQAIEDHAFPGACIVVGDSQHVILKKCYGYHTYEKKQPTTLNDLFDLASLTKVVGTTPAIMKLVEMGKIKLDDPVIQYLPEIGNHHNQNASWYGLVKIKQLLNHTSGFPAINPVEKLKNTTIDQRWKAILETPLKHFPGEKEIYSDINFILLGKIVERVSGLSFDQALKKSVFIPLGMNNTQFNPTNKLRLVPTREADNLIEVHDPRARSLGGIAGHAGLFSNAEDLQKYAYMLLNKGRFNRSEFFSADTLKLFTTRCDAIKCSARALGWDTVNNPNSTEIKRQYSPGLAIDTDAFGHTGFTGTSLWVSPHQNLYMIVLTNRVYHENDRTKRSDFYWRQKIATSILHQLGYLADNGLQHESKLPLKNPGPVLSGIDQLISNHYQHLISGKRIALVVNESSVDRHHQQDIDVVLNMPNVKIQAIFTPEHGLDGKSDDKVSDSSYRDIPVYSLYGKNRTPSANQLENIDAIVFDLQPIGLRYFTYISTLANIMNAADQNGKEVIVLDRVDPLGGNKIEGAMVSPELQGRFTSYFNIPTQYGMTVGELARYYKKFGQLSVKLEVVPLLNWDREKLFNETKLDWRAPSPSLPTFEQGILYSIFGPLETTKLAVGRGVSPLHAFKYYGAPWISMSDALTLSNNLNQLNLPGLVFEPVTWTPDRREHKGEVCHGFQVKITSLKDIQGFYSLIKVTELLYAKFGNQLGIAGMDGMLGEKWVREAIMRQCPVGEILNQTLVERQEFMRQRETVLMY